MYIYYLPVSADYTCADTGLLPYVSSERQARIKRYAHDHSKKLALYSALLTRMVISRFSGITPSRLRFSCTDNQKPVFLNDPSIHFNFSHTNGAILCALSCESPVGVDIEPLREQHAGVVRKAFHPEERAALEQKVCSFVEIWTRKEAYTKMLGTGIACELTAINTLSNELSAALKTWQEDSFICSACGDLTEFQKIRMTVTDIRKFYHSL